MSKSSAAPGPSRVPVFALLSLGAFVLLMVAIVKWLAGGSVANSSQSLVELRADYATDLTRESPSPQPDDPELEEAFDGNWVNFESDGRLLFGCLRFPRGEGPHPVAVYCHGGFAMGVSDIRDVDPLLAAGYAVFVPAWRGENGNAGNFEMFYGEVDDAVAAMDFLAQLPEIDENAISLVGHSAGATIALLAAECSDRANAVIACSPVVNVTELVRLFGPEIYEEAPFDVLDTWETDLRSPIHFLDELNCPAHLYFGSEEKELLGLTEKIGQDVREQPHAVRIELVDQTDHFTMLPQAIEACIPVLKAVPKTTRGSPVTKADYRRFSLAHWTQAKPRQPLPAVARIQQWNSGPDPGPAVQNAHQFTKWLRHDLYVAKRPALRSYPASPGWLTSQDFRDNFELISLDGTQRRTFTGPIPNLLRTAQHVQFFPAGVSADGALFAVRWTGVAEGNSRSQSWISIHQASDGKSVYHTENVDRCVCLPKGRVLFYHVDPQSVRGQTKTLSVSIVDIATGETRLERPYDDLEQLYATLGGQQLLVAKELAGGTRLQVYSAEDGSEMSVADYPDVSLGENMALSQDGKEVAIVAQRRLTVIDLSTGRIALSRRVSNVHQVVEWLDDGRFLLLSQNVILERRTGRQLTTLRHQINPRRKLSLYGRWLVPQEVTARYGPPTAIPLPTVRKLADSPTRSQRPKVALRFYGFDHPELLSGTQEALFTGFGLDCAERNKTDDCDAVLSFNYDGERVADGERRQTKLILHGRELPADIPRAGIMNTPAPTNVSVSGSLMSPDMDEFQYKDSKVSTGLLMEEFETVRGECRFSDDLPFDMGLPQQTQIQIVGMMDAIGKLDYPPTEEFQLRPGARQWLRTGLPKSDSTVEPPSQIAGAWSLDSPQILQQAGDDKVRAVVHQMIDGEHGVVGSLTFAMRDEEPIVLAGLEGPCIKEIRLSQEQRELIRVRNGAFAPPFQNSADRRRWFLQSGGMLFVGDTSSDGEPRRHLNFNQALDKSQLTSQGEFLVQLPAQRSKQKELHVHRFDKLLQENGRDGGLPQPERVITEAAYAKYFALPDSDDLLAVEFQAVRRVNVTTGKDVWRSELPESVTSRYETNTTADGTLGIICRQDREQLLIFVNPESGELGATEPYVPAEPRTYSPDHSMYVTVFEKNYIRICSTATDEVLWKTEVGSSNNRMQINTRSCIAWSPDGRYLALGCNSMDRGVRKCAIDVWDVAELAP